MRKLRKKLALNRETLRRLQAPELGRVAGAAGGTQVTMEDMTTCVCTDACNPCTGGCGTATGCPHTDTCTLQDLGCCTG